MNDRRRVVGAYLAAKDRVIAAGFEAEIRWQESRDLDKIDERDFLAEAAWVVLAAGLSDKVVRSVFSRLSIAFLEWRSAHDIINDARGCRLRALRVFNNPRKVSAIIEIARLVGVSGFESVRARIRAEGPDYLEGMPYIGPATSKHLAKNIGMRVAKPDRHLLRIAATFRYMTVDALCSDIAEVLGENPSVVDLVLWRDATTNPSYLQCLLDDYWAAAEA